MNIKKVVNDDLCTGCGTCVAICPKNAILLTINKYKGIYVPKIDYNHCNNCGMCFKVCSGHEVNLKQLNLEIYGKNTANNLIGNYLNCYIGHSNDYLIRYNSSSGGLITQFLIFALEEGIIDGALVTRMKKENPLEPEPFIARTKNDIIEASKSKYCPVPANIALKEIINSKSEERFAVVGLPCHMHAIRKAEQLNKELKDKVVLHVGIFCGHTSNFLGNEFWLNKLKIKKEVVKDISYRGEGWPGIVKINLKNDKSISTSFLLWGIYFNLHFFTPKRCFICSDIICELSDISFGDAWLPEISDDTIGSSIIITRTIFAEKLLKKMLSRDIIEINNIEPIKVLQSQLVSTYLKKTYHARNLLFNEPTEYKIDDKLKINFLDYLIGLFLYFNSYICSKSIMILILAHIPIRILNLYALPYSKIISKKSRKLLAVQDSE